MSTSTRAGATDATDPPPSNPPASATSATIAATDYPDTSSIYDQQGRPHDRAPCAHLSHRQRLDSGLRMRLAHHTTHPRTTRHRRRRTPTQATPLPSPRRRPRVRLDHIDIPDDTDSRVGESEIESTRVGDSAVSRCPPARSGTGAKVGGRVADGLGTPPDSSVRNISLPPSEGYTPTGSEYRWRHRAVPAWA